MGNQPSYRDIKDLYQRVTADVLYDQFFTYVQGLPYRDVMRIIESTAICRNFAIENHRRVFASPEGTLISTLSQLLTQIGQFRGTLGEHCLIGLDKQQYDFFFPLGVEGRFLKK